LKRKELAAYIIESLLSTIHLHFLQLDLRAGLESIHEKLLLQRAFRPVFALGGTIHFQKSSWIEVDP